MGKQGPVPDRVTPAVAHRDHEAVEEGAGEMSAQIDAASPLGGAEPPSDGARVVQDAPTTGPAQRRVDFGAHLEANYQRLVAQLYAITLDPGEAHGVVQDAYSRAWRAWSTVGTSSDPTGWIRRVAVRSTIRSWRRVLPRLGVGRRTPAAVGADPRTAALLGALRRMSAPERRAVVLHNMAGGPLVVIGTVEGASVGTTAARLSRGQQLVAEGLAEVLPEVLGSDGFDMDDVPLPPAEPVEIAAYEAGYVDDGRDHRP